MYSVESCPEKSRPIKYGGQMHGVMIAIEYSYKLDRKKTILSYRVQTRPVIAQTVTYIEHRTLPFTAQNEILNIIGRNNRPFKLQKIF